MRWNDSIENYTLFKMCRASVKNGSLSDLVAQSTPQMPDQLVLDGRVFVAMKGGTIPYTGQILFALKKCRYPS
jgi:hypothetical protein